VNKLKRSMAGMPARASSTTRNNQDVIPVITPDTFKVLMDILSPIPVNHTSSHADMIKNVVLEEARRKIEAIYNKDSY
jgi:hypothetical protein